MSAPASPGASSTVSASRSEATATNVSRPCAASISGLRSRTAPLDPGYCTRRPKKSPSGRPSVVSATTTSMPSASARVCTTAIVWANVSASTRKRSDLLFLFDRCASVIASAAAVPSSSSDAFAVGSPVRSETTVWKFSSASSRPWEISGWYGVYAVYQAGFSTRRRTITDGVKVP